VRKRTLGSYSRNGSIIRINPVLDRKSVPQFYIEFVLYHEMLHADMGLCEKNGRRVVHSGGFRDRERLFRRYRKALAWEKRKGF
jgi:predicted metal-dependent hydrolase